MCIRRRKDIGLALMLIFLYSCPCFSQETNSHPSGRVYSSINEKIASVGIIIIHGPTQTRYVGTTRDDGYFQFFNLKPGGPYSITLQAADFETLTINNLFLHLGSEKFTLDNAEISDFLLQKKSIILDEVVVKAVNGKTTTGIETTLGNAALQLIPSISRNFQDILRLVPQAKVTGEGSISLAGQNNRFNAFFIDGANNSDISGLSVNGMNGGQTGSPPVSIEALEEINVLLSPYDVQYGNFTGGSINVLTRSGSNTSKSSAWYYFRNEDMAGRWPLPIEKPGAPGEFHRPRLSQFMNQTYGIWNSGALKKNKVFYFALIERQSELRPQPFAMNEYRGNSNQQQLKELYDFVKTTYNHDAGSFLETKDELKATRISVKLDWNASLKNKLMLAYRRNKAERNFQPRPGSNTNIIFSNSAAIIPSSTHSVSFEWKRFLNNNKNNRLLLIFTNQVDARKWSGQAFPGVTIADGSGVIGLGSEGNTGITNFRAKEFTLFNVFTQVKDKHIFTAGADLNYIIHDRSIIPNYFGSYQFRNINDFMNGTASRLTKGFYLVDNARELRSFELLRNGLFISDKINVSPNFILNAGIRLDLNSILSKPREDLFFNDTAVTIISRYYDLDGAVSGRVMRSLWNLSPRISAEYKIKKININLKTGAGIFSGHTINAWTNDLFNNITGNIDINPQQYNLKFNPDPYNQPTPQFLNIDPASFKGNLCLQSKHFKYPSVFRSSLSVEKKWRQGWNFSIEGIFTKNIQEVVFRNVNIIPPTHKSAAPDTRNIYSTGLLAPKIELRANGIKNPYSGIFLLTNNENKKGKAWSLSFIVQKQAPNFSFNGSYTYGSSRLLFEITGAQTPISSQWRNMETVNGRNNTGLSISDNDIGHRIVAWISQRFNYGKHKTSSTISVFYNGQSGTPYSYVYSTSMINDNGVTGENFDLIYIPTSSDLAMMNFVPVTSGGQVIYSAQQQKDLLNTFIENDKYLRKHRGEFSERNGARLPFTHIIDLKLQQDFLVKIGSKKVGITVSYDVFNFTNMLNRKWGAIYFLSNDSYPLITFAGWANSSSFTPQYQFRTFGGKPYSLQTSSLPGASARWLSQLGLKINLE